jgi:hypothetical protein
LFISQEGKCYWTGKPMSIETNDLTDASLDRIDNSKPHTYENCILTMRALNLGRNDASLIEWVSYLNMMGLLSPEQQLEFKQYLVTV